MRPNLRMKAQVLHKHVEIRRVAYSQETSVTSLSDCCAGRGTRLRETGMTGSLVFQSDRRSLRRERSGPVVVVVTVSTSLFFCIHAAGNNNGNGRHLYSIT